MPKQAILEMYVANITQYYFSNHELRLRQYKKIGVIHLIRLFLFPRPKGPGPFEAFEFGPKPFLKYTTKNTKDLKEYEER